MGSLLRRTRLIALAGLIAISQVIIVSPKPAAAVVIHPTTIQCTTDGTLQRLYSDIDSPKSTAATYTTASYTNTDMTLTDANGVTTGWRKHTTVNTITNTSPYTVTNLSVPIPAVGIRYPRTNNLYHPQYWDDAQGIFLSYPAWTPVGSYQNANEPNAGYAINFSGPESASVRLPVTNFPIPTAPTIQTFGSYLSPGATIDATATIPVFTPALTTLAPGESTTVTIVNYDERGSGSTDDYYLDYVIGSVQCNPTVPPSPTQAVVCDANNDDITLSIIDTTKVATTDSGWTNNTRTITYTPALGYAAFDDGTTSKVYTFTDNATACPPPVIRNYLTIATTTTCGATNDTFALAVITEGNTNAKNSASITGYTLTYSPYTTDGHTTLTITADPGYEFWNSTTEQWVTSMTVDYIDNAYLCPVGPTTVDECSTPNDTVTIPAVEGWSYFVVYDIDSDSPTTVPIAAGTYAASTFDSSSFTITALRDGQTESYQWPVTLTDTACTPGKGDIDTPPATTPVISVLPIELPHTGPSGTSGAEGLILALVAAVATYGAVYFAQAKRAYK